MQKLSVIIPYLNEEEYIGKTIESINQTSDSSTIDIIAIDDCSKKQVDLSRFRNVRVIRNQQRKGVDACRKSGVELSENKHCLILDAHMLFKNDNWSNKMIKYIDDNPQTLFCTVCCGLGYGKNSMDDHNGKYFGADLKILTDQEKNRPCRNILEPKWASEKQGDEYSVNCILGANYFFSRDWFIHTHSLTGLKSWGTSEPAMSLKSFLAGGDCKITKQIEIGHVFRDTAPYATPVSDLVYNKIYLLKTIFPKELGDKLISYLPKDGNYNAAMKMIEENRVEIESERQYYQSIFKCSIYDLCKKLSIKLPC